MKKKIEVKDILGKVIFTYECEDNSVKKTVEEAVKQKISLYCADLNGVDLRGADLCNANLNGANLRGANLRNAKVYGADLCCSNLRSANLRWADLRDTNLNGVNLNATNLCDADLRCTDLRDVDLCNANLNGADLYGAILNGTNLDSAKNIPFIPFVCPSEGSFIAWKKVDNCIVKLFIPEDAKRSSSTTNKCRCDKAKVLEITNLETNEHIDEVINYNYEKCVYKVGEMVYPDRFDDNRWDECSNGIHFFVNKKEAIAYRI